MSNIINEDNSGALADYINKYVKSGKGKTVGQLLADLTERFENVKDYKMQAEGTNISGYANDIASKLSGQAKQFLGGENGAKSFILRHFKALAETGKATINGRAIKPVNGSELIIGEETKINYFNY